VSHDDPIADMDLNVGVTLRLLQWAERIGVGRFLNASSMAVYGPSAAQIPETTPFAPSSFYGASKASAETYVSLCGRRGLATTSFRLFNVYGPGQNLTNLRQGMASIYLAYLLRGEPIHVKGSLDRYRDMVHVSDVVEAWLAALSDARAIGKVYNVGTGKTPRIRG
jgi:UDP-glucose 4-epimerase